MDFGDILDREEKMMRPRSNFIKKGQDGSFMDKRMELYTTKGSSGSLYMAGKGL